ncbi:DUF1707 domain-containing protein [Spongiactinospora sp. TRM90649]|uniref:DUF1707 SHOCT-like domain-containing protein n=1 Tax=Spongiactinospora sp. TRM90649 TaxID=3031114 RepID=UPI0023F881DD|nr:DUF1707 domain-containing protein [Spongiactinospora sp. TRM90649]MDF5757852.1 DUF1707 domain-containing protein [Spongiactinospora sp. TRM90649]
MSSALPGKADQRASDAERDQVATVLAEALATGRLTSVEHADRLAATYSAVTVGDLVPITGDLPAPTGTMPAASMERQQVGAIFSKVIRGGRWVPARHTEMRSTFGALIVDLTEAVLPGREITLELNAFCGKLIVRVPPNARVVEEGGVLFGKRQVVTAAGHGRDDESGPLIRITGRAVFSKIMVVP